MNIRNKTLFGRLWNMNEYGVQNEEKISKQELCSNLKEPLISPGHDETGEHSANCPCDDCRMKKPDESFG